MTKITKIIYVSMVWNISMGQMIASPETVTDNNVNIVNNESSLQRSNQLVGDSNVYNSTFADFAQQLSSENWRDRARAYHSMPVTESVSSKVIETLNQGIKDSDFRVRVNVAEKLVDLISRSAEEESLNLLIPSLIDMLEDDYWQVAEHAARCLELMGPRANSAVPTLIREFGKGNRDTNFAIGRALINIAPESTDVKLVLRDSLKGEGSTIRQIAAECIGDVGYSDLDTLYALEIALRDSSQFVQIASATALRAIASKSSKAIEILHTALDENDAGLRSVASWALGSTKTNKTEASGVNNRVERKVIVRGSQLPYVDNDLFSHDWYGRSMIAIIDENRWIMALRSGFNHIDKSGKDAIHLLTSNDEGRSWNPLNVWFDGSQIDGMPYQDEYTHSEPGLFRMPNGDLILQFWKNWNTAGTKQLRSLDNGKTWKTDIDQITISGVDSVDGSLAIGTQDYFVDPMNGTDVYMAFQYYRIKNEGSTTSIEGDSPRSSSEYRSGALLALSRDNGHTYEFLSWIGPLNEDHFGGEATFEPSIEYIGNGRILAVLRDATMSGGGGLGTRKPKTWQTVSTNMGKSFGPLADISEKIDGGFKDGFWGRARIYSENNIYFRDQDSAVSMDAKYKVGNGRIWGFGFLSKGGSMTRTPVLYWTDDNGETWEGPMPLEDSFYPGNDTGYGDIKMRKDGTLVAATYYSTNNASSEADSVQYEIDVVELN